MITKLSKVEENVFIINESVKVSFKQIEDLNDAIVEIEFDESILTEQEANELANELIEVSIQKYKENMESKGFKEVE